MSAFLALFLDVTVSVSGPSLLFSKVRRYTLTDALNTIPELVVEVLCDDPALDLAALIGESAVALLNEEPLLPRFDGIVRAVEQLSAEPSGASWYALTLAPTLWLTSERSAHRIFRQKTVFEILGRILGNYNQAIPEAERRLTRAVTDWKEHDYRVQYGETDRELVLRLLSEEGLVSYWAPSATDPQTRVWTLTDDTSVGGPVVEVPFCPPSGAMVATGPHVRAASVKARLAPSEVKLRDYDYEKPAFTLESRVVAGEGVPAEAALVRYGFAVGGFADDATGIALAQIRLEAARARSRVYRWETSFTAPAGAKVRLHDHPREDANGDFLVVSMRTEVEPNRRSHVAELVPAAFAWRPELRAKPRIHGTQTAFVVGAAGQEVDVDQEGRVAVEFRWDTRDLHTTAASRRVRVAMPWAGADRGFWTVPRVGDEVVIAYQDGDPDQPMVVGSVNNALAPPALNPATHATQSWWKSRTTPNGGPTDYNAIFMDDAKGRELLAFHAQRDLRTEVGRDTTTVVGGASAVSVVEGHSTQIGGDAKTTVKGKYELEASDILLQAGGEMVLAAKGRYDGSDSHLIASKWINVNGDQVINLTSAGTIVLTVGSSSITIADGKITIAAPLVEINP